MKRHDLSARAAGLLLALGGCLGAQAADFEISQKGKTFLHNKAPAATLRVKAGDSVNFRNDDPFFHNVYSASSAKPFDLGSYPQGQSRKVTFDKEGTVEVECAIHPDMKLKVEVAK